MKMTNEIRKYLAIAMHVACETDDPTDDQLESMVAAASAALAIIRQQPRGAAATDRVMAQVKAHMVAAAGRRQPS